MGLLKFLYLFVSITSIFLYVLSVQFKDKKSILITQLFASFCYLVVYIIKGAMSGVAIEVIEEIKDFVFVRIEKENKIIPFYVLFIFLIMLVLASIYFYDGILSLLPLLINILLFVSTYFKNPNYIRWVMLITGILWGVYNTYVGAYIIVIGNVLEVISAIVSIKRFNN